MVDYIAYYRVSTDKQGVSGLGLEAQKNAVERFLDVEPIQEYVEVESGRKASRPKLLEALEACRKKKATLIVAKLDRLARNTAFLLKIIESNVDVAFCDLPDLPSGHMSKFFLTMMAAVAELESGMVSDRTKAAMKAAKERGVVIGATGKARARENQDQALAFAKMIEPVLIEVIDSGKQNFNRISRELNQRGVRTMQGGKWHPQSVKRVVERLSI